MREEGRKEEKSSRMTPFYKKCRLGLRGEYTDAATKPLLLLCDLFLLVGLSNIRVCSILGNSLYALMLMDCCEPGHSRCCCRVRCSVLYLYCESSCRA